MFTQDPNASLGTLPLVHLELLLEVWAHRYAELGAREDVEYVFPFENRGVEVGVTLHHPHGQIYAYPFVPPVAARELPSSSAYCDAHGRGLLEDHAARASSRTAAAVLYTGRARRGARAGVRAVPVRGLDRAARAAPSLARSDARPSARTSRAR